MPRRTDKHRHAAIDAVAGFGHDLSGHFTWIWRDKKGEGRLGINHCRNGDCGAKAYVTSTRWFGLKIKKQCKHRDRRDEYFEMRQSAIQKAVDQMVEDGLLEKAEDADIVSFGLGGEAVARQPCPRCSDTPGG